MSISFLLCHLSFILIVNQDKEVTETHDDDDKKEVDETENINVTIKFNNDTMTHIISKNTDSWTEKSFEKLQIAIKSHFNLSHKFIIRDKLNKEELEDIDDIKDEYEAQQDDVNFANLHLVIELTETPSTKQISKV